MTLPHLRTIARAAILLSLLVGFLVVDFLAWDDVLSRRWLSAIADIALCLAIILVLAALASRWIEPHEPD